MPQIITMPKLGLTMNSGKITLWLKREGDAVQAGEALLEMETEKISSTVESPVDGVVLKLLAEEWDEKEIGAPLCVLGASGEAWDGTLPQAAQAAETPVLTKTTALENTSAQSAPAERLLASPAARRVAEENGIDLRAVQGSGPEGRIERKDVEQALAARAAAPAVKDVGGIAVAKRIPLSGAKKVSAERLTMSKRDIPHVYFKTSADVSELLARKAAAAQAAEAAGKRKPTLNDAVVLCAAKALAEFTEINAALSGPEILCYADVNIGIATNTPKGLYVPVVRGADKLSLQELAERSSTLIGRAREGMSLPDDLSGGTFTVSNLGASGIEEFSAVINPPQTAILAVGAVIETPVARDGGIFIVPMLKLTLSVDHRVIDGALAAQFLMRVRQIMETPA